MLSMMSIRAARTLTFTVLALATCSAHAIPHRGFTHPTVQASRQQASSAYWQTAFNQPIQSVLLVVPMATPRAVGVSSVAMPEPGTFYAKDIDGQASLFDQGSDWLSDAWQPVPAFKPLPSVRPGVVTVSLETGPDGLPPPVALPVGPKVPPKNWRSKMIDNAKKYLGIPYVWGGNSPEQGMDCSGFVRWVTAMTIGKALPRLASQQSQVGMDVPKDELQPGDLVFFDTARGPATHVGIYVGHDTFINAPHTGAKVRYENLTSDYWEARWHGARRIVQTTITTASR
ncbi:C40 family peptidase [Paraburkholderia sp. C35]|uniref:C40 family peptidase n=1 Tax=Paraburkholderia sp. C35 TaxID=2126993 RepID=UPI000D68B4C2|nr:C40 family peptidase [Paraburkholderia sp. C35]